MKVRVLLSALAPLVVLGFICLPNGRDNGLGVPSGPNACEPSDGAPDPGAHLKGRRHDAPQHPAEPPVPSPFTTRLPAAFVMNEGQWSPDVLAGASRPGRAIRLEAGVIAIGSKRGALRMRFLDSDPEAKLEGDGEERGRHSYFLGNDPSHWRSNVPGYELAVFLELYPGIDVRVKSPPGCLVEYDLLLQPGADLSQVRVRCEGAQALRLDDHGNLVVETEAGEIVQTIPATWWVLPSGERREAQCRFRLLGERTFGFELEGRFENDDWLLVIDPKMDWSTYLGGEDSDFAEGLVEDPSTGDILLAGTTLSIGFPATAGAFDTTYNGGPPLAEGDAFISRLTADGTTLLWATYLGGTEGEQGEALALDGTDIVVVGRTRSSGFPVSPGSFDPILSGPTDAFITKLDSAGAQLLYSTFLGGDSNEAAFDVGFASPSVVVVTGITWSPDFPTTPGSFSQQYGGSRDGFVTSLDMMASQLSFSTFLGGSQDDFVSRLAIEPSGRITVVGSTESPDFPTTPGAFDKTLDGQADGFIAKLEPAGDRLVYSTLMGGADREGIFALEVDDTGVAHVGGTTGSNDFPVTSNAFDTTFNGGHLRYDGFVASLDPTGATLLSATFLGGTSGEGVYGIHMAPSGDLVIAGPVQSRDFPVTPDAPWPTHGGGDGDAFIARLNGEKTVLIFSTYLGGAGTDGISSLQLSATGEALVTGLTGSSDFPATPGSFDTLYNGGEVDAFASRLSVGPWLRFNGIPAAGHPVSYTVTSAPLGSSATFAQVVLSCTGSAGVILPGGYVLPITVDTCTLLSLHFSGLLTAQIDASGTGQTPTILFPVVPPGITVHGAAIVWEPTTGDILGVTGNIGFTIQ